MGLLSGKDVKTWQPLGLKRLLDKVCKLVHRINENGA